MYMESKHICYDILRLLHFLGFAAFVEYIGTDHVEPSWKMMDQFAYANVESVMTLDSHNKSHPISVKVSLLGKCLLK